MRKETVAIAFVFSLGCSGSEPERTTTVASLPTPVVSAAQVAPTASPTGDWPCVKPEILTERQETTLERMTQSGRPDLVQQAAEIRAKLCAAWAARANTP